MKRHLPWILVAGAAAWVVASWRYPEDAPGEAQVRKFAQLPVVRGGRVMPTDTTARNLLRIVLQRETFLDGVSDDDPGKRRPAVQWLLEAMCGEDDAQGRAGKRRVFRIDHQQLLDTLGLKRREGSRYAFEEFWERINPGVDKTFVKSVMQVAERQEAKQPVDAYEQQLVEFWRHVKQYDQVAAGGVPHVIPPSGGHDWRLREEAASDESAVPYVKAWRGILLSYARNDTAKFNEAVASYAAALERERPKDSNRAALEARFNEADPFNTCKWFYLLGFVLTCLGFLGWTRPLERAAWALMAFTFVVHTISLVMRIYLSGRPPVTNLYSSAVFIGWACVLLGLIFERLFRLGAGNIVAAVAGFVTLQIAHILAADGDTMEVLVAVLDTPFWLSTHVVCITLGYATTYVSGLLGLIYVLRGTLTPSLTPEIARNLTRMTYGTTCFATFFSFIGTVLGGLWADDSWGRFWGWDAKENGALMIVLWNALVLHARWGGLVRERGIALLAIFGNIIVSWSWFGVNQLGVGLHSYGKATGITVCLVVFALSQLAVIGLGMKPLHEWKSALPQKGAHGAPPSEGNGGG